MARKRRDDILAPIVSDLEEDIIFGRLRSFERLTEEDVMGRFDVTRHMARQVLLNLMARGIVEKDRAGGTVVRDFSVEEIESIYEVREVLQRHAIQRMPLPASPETIANLRKIHQSYERAVDAKDLREIFRLNDEFHDTLFAACGNDVLAEAIKTHTWLTHGVRSRVFSDPDHLRRARDDHKAMIDAMESGDRKELTRISDEHLVHPKRAYLVANPKLF